jgi:hypothetical protein
VCTLYLGPGQYEGSGAGRLAPHSGIRQHYRYHRQEEDHFLNLVLQYVPTVSRYSTEIKQNTTLITGKV